MSDTILGVVGKRHLLYRYDSGGIQLQRWTAARPIPSLPGHHMVVELRFDDRCKNGHSTFSITSDTIDVRREVVSCGTFGAEASELFPELAPLVMWHGCSTDGPLHYVANTRWFCAGRDHRGLLKGEQRRHISRDGTPGWCLVDEAGKRVYTVESQVWTESPPPAPVLRWAPLMIEGEGNPVDLDIARRTAVWPDATDEDLRPEGLEERLLARLPALLERFRATMTDVCGFVLA